jgi:hypothetical protein
MMHLFTKSFSRRLARLFEAVAAVVEKPAMVETAKPAIFDAAVAQVGAAVRAVPPEEPKLTAIIAKQHQVLAHDAHWKRCAVGWQFFDKSHRLPIPPQQITPGSAGAGAGQ